jgi:hypothetical protein
MTVSFHKYGNFFPGTGHMYEIGQLWGISMLFGIKQNEKEKRKQRQNVKEKERKRK